MDVICRNDDTIIMIDEDFSFCWTCYLQEKKVDSECIPLNTVFQIIFQNGHKTHLTEEKKEIIKNSKLIGYVDYEKIQKGIYRKGTMG